MITNNSINRPNVAFLYYNEINQTGVTGDSTVYTVQYTSKIHDSTNSFDGLSTFTAPISGMYFFQYYLPLINYVGYSTVDLQIVSTNYTCDVPSQFQYTGDPTMIIIYNQDAILKLTAGDTVTTTLSIGNDVKTVTIVGASLPSQICWFGGYLIAEL